MASAEVAAAVDVLYVTLYDTFRAKEVPPEGGEPRHRAGAFVPMKKDADAPAGVVDMSTWQPLDEHVRDALDLNPDPTKLELSLSVEIKLSNVPNPMKIQISSQQGLFILRKSLERKSVAELKQLHTIEMYVQKKLVFGVHKGAPKRAGKHAVQERKRRDLSAVLYGDGSAGRQHQEAEWTEECDYLVAKDPVSTMADPKPRVRVAMHAFTVGLCSTLTAVRPPRWQHTLRGFFRAREAVRKALGRQAHMINPKRCFCPFISTKKGTKCGQKHSGTVRGRDRWAHQDGRRAHQDSTPLYTRRWSSTASTSWATLSPTSRRYTRAIAQRPLPRRASKRQTSSARSRRRRSTARERLTGRARSTRATRRFAPSATSPTHSSQTSSSARMRTPSGSRARARNSSEIACGAEARGLCM